MSLTLSILTQSSSSGPFYSMEQRENRLPIILKFSSEKFNFNDKKPDVYYSNTAI